MSKQLFAEQAQRHLFHDMEGFRIVYLPGEYVMHFQVFEIVGIVEGTKEILFLRAGGDESTDTVAETNFAQAFASGTVKWDGCSDIYFDECDRGMIHFCSRENVKNLAAVLDTLYDLAETHVAKADPVMLA